MKITPAGKQDLASAHALEHVLFGYHAYPQFFFRQAFDCWPQGLSLAVDGQHRGKGIARSLVKNAIVKASSGSVIKLTVDPNNVPACKLYTSLGFKVLEKEEEYFGDGEARLVMALAR